LLERGDKPADELAREMGLKRNQLYKSRREAQTRGQQDFPGSGRHPPNLPRNLPG